MSEKQWRRLDVVERIERGEMTIAEGATALAISSRHMKRIRKRVSKNGASVVVHGNKGQAPKHRIATLVRTRVVQLRRELYRGFNDQHFTEKLRPSHNKRFAIPAQDAHQAWRPSADADALDSLCALQYVRLVANNNTVRIRGHIIDIPRKLRGRSYAKAYVVVRHLLDGRYRVFHGNELVAEASGEAPRASTYEPRSITAREVMHKKAAKKRAEVTDSLNYCRVTDSLSVDSHIDFA